MKRFHGTPGDLIIMEYPKGEEKVYFAGEGGEFPNVPRDIPLDPETGYNLHRPMTLDEEILFLKWQLGNGWVDIEREGI